MARGPSTGDVMPTALVRVRARMVGQDGVGEKTQGRGLRRAVQRPCTWGGHALVSYPCFIPLFHTLVSWDLGARGYFDTYPYIPRAESVLKAPSASCGRLLVLIAADDLRSTSFPGGVFHRYEMRVFHTPEYLCATICVCVKIPPRAEVP